MSGLAARKWARWWWRITLLVLLASCGGGESTTGIIPVDGRRVPAEQLQKSVAHLCTAQSFVGREDLENARATFQNLAHDDLHTLADAIDELDRSAQSQLLRAKNRVESDFSAGDLSALKADFPGLIDAAEAALSVLQIEEPGCPRSS